MVRRRVGRSMLVLLGACVLAGCTSSRGLPRALRLSVLDMQRPPADVETDEIASRASSDRDEASKSDETRADSWATSADDAEPRPQTFPPVAFNSAKVRRSQSPERRAVRRPAPHDADDADDDLTVLLTQFEDEARPLSPPADGAEKPVASSRLQVPPELPGSEVQGLQVPPFDPQQSQAERRAAIQMLYPELPELPSLASDDPSQPRWSLAELEEMAWEHHPALMQASAQVEVARGAMIQAGLHPNPTVGWEQDTIGPGIQGYKGPYVSQQIVTGGKLKLARCAAAMDYENAQIAYQRMRVEIATRVRDAYFDVLVSQQRRRMLVALARFTDDIYRAQIELVAGGQAAPYEPLQLRVFAVQARNSVVDAQNGLIAAGRRLGAATGMSDAEEFHVAGRADETPAPIDYLSAKAFLLDNHSDLRSARNQIVQSQYLSRLEYIRPRIPDISAYGTYQHAYGVAPFINSYNFQVGAPIPIFDRNQGNILSTQSSIINRERAFAAAKNDLTGRLAEVLSLYHTTRTQAENYRHHLLPDQVRTYRGVYSRYREGGQAANDNLNFGDVIVAQQTLATAVNGYADVLNQMWQAYVDAADLLQIEDLATLSAWFGQGD